MKQIKISRLRVQVLPGTSLINHVITRIIETTQRLNPTGSVLRCKTKNLRFTLNFYHTKNHIIKTKRMGKPILFCLQGMLPSQWSMVEKKPYHLTNGKISCKQGRFRWRKGLKEAEGGCWSETKVNQSWRM